MGVTADDAQYRRHNTAKRGTDELISAASGVGASPCNVRGAPVITLAAMAGFPFKTVLPTPDIHARDLAGLDEATGDLLGIQDYTDRSGVLFCRRMLSGSLLLCYEMSPRAKKPKYLGDVDG